MRQAAPHNLFWILTLCLIVGIAPATADDTPDTELVETLVARLSSRSYRAREKAQKQLVSQGFAALKLLRKAHTETTDAEAKWRLERVIERITKPRWRTDLVGAMRKAKTSGKLVMVFSTIGDIDGFA